MPGLRAGRGVEVGGVVAVRLEDGLTGVDARTGAVRWSFPLAGNAGSPVVEAGTDAFALGSEDGTVMLVDVADGRRRWSVVTDGAVASMVATAGDVLLVTGAPGFYRAFRTSDGTPLWAVRGPDSHPGLISSGHGRHIAVVGDTAATLTWLRGVIALRRDG